MFVYKREVRTTFRGATQTEYFVLNKAFTRHSKTGQCHFNSSWKEASPTLRLVLTVLMSVYFWSKGKEYIYIVTIADFSPTFRRLLSTFTLRRDSPDCPLLFLLLMFTLCFMCSTSTELDDIGSSREVLCLYTSLWRCIGVLLFLLDYSAVTLSCDA